MCEIVKTPMNGVGAEHTFMVWPSRITLPNFFKLTVKWSMHERRVQ